MPLVAGDELLGLLVAEYSAALELARAVGSQVAVGIKRIQLIERLTERNRVKDFFDHLASGRDRGLLEGSGAHLGCDLDLPHVVLVAEPADEAFERALAGLLPGSLFDRREDVLRGLLRVPARGERAATEIVQRVHAESPRLLAVGLSSVCAGATTFAEGFEEARQALFGTTVLGREASVVAFEDLGAHKYLLRIASDSGVRDATIEAVGRVADYDRERGASLLLTLEEFLQRRGSIGATSEALFIHAEHSPPTASPDRRPLRDRPPSRRLADGRDRREARSAQARARCAVDAIPIFARPTMEALAIVRVRSRMIGPL